MNNIEFLQEIKSKICKITFEDQSGYYVMIPFIKYNESLRKKISLSILNELDNLVLHGKYYI